MSNPLRYIKALEAAGFARSQAEAQVQMVLDAIEGDLVTKSDLAVLQERIESRFALVDSRFSEFNSRFSQVELQIKEAEFRTVTRLGILTVSTVSVAVALLAWFLKVQ